jgi:hypothetical protein
MSKTDSQTFRTMLDELIRAYAVVLGVSRTPETFPLAADPTGGLPAMPHGECFNNARQTQRLHGHDMCIGWGLAADGWSAHCWNVAPAGAIDVTWRPPGAEYRGVRLTRREVDRAGTRLDDVIDLANELTLDSSAARGQLEIAGRLAALPRRERRALFR